MNPPDVALHLQPEGDAPFAAVEVDLRWTSWGRGLTLPRSISLDQPQRVSAYRLVMSWTDISTESLRVHYSAIPRMIGRGSVGAAEDIGDGPRSPLTTSYHYDERLGSQSFGLFPALVLLDQDRPLTLISAASEQRDRHSWSWSAHRDRFDLVLQFDRWGLGHRAPLVHALDLEAVFLQSLDGKPFGPAVFSGLHEALGGRFGPGSGDLFWGSWNDGHFRDIDQERILETARWLKKNIPSAKWIQIDDGWAPACSAIGMSDPANHETLEMSHLGAFYRPEELGPEPRFPEGMKGLATAIKQEGLKPMIWLTPSVLETCPMVRDQPDWFQDRARLHFFRELRFLDFSVPEARALWVRVMNTVFGQWGFEGCKLDYWSMGFDQHDVECRLGEQSSMELMAWMLDSLRTSVGKDGMLLYGIDLPFGTPFRSKWFNQFRCYADSEGSCQSVVAMEEQALWTAFLGGLYQVQRYWSPDGDGLGVFDHFDMPDSHFRLWCSFLLGSGTLTELAGWLHLKPQGGRLQELIRVAKAARHGCRISNPGFDFLDADQNAPTLWVRHDSENLKLAALTNWRAWDAEVNLTADDLELPPGARLKCLHSGGEVQLPATLSIGPEDGRVFWATTA